MIKNKAATWVLLIAVIAVVIGVVVFELDHYDVIDLDYVPKFPGLAYEDLGSAKKLEGDVTVVSVFASDANMKWDFSRSEDVSLRGKMFDYTETALLWLAGQAEKYGKSVDFHYAADENDDLLYYEADLGERSVYSGSESHEQSLEKAVSAPDEWEFIRENVRIDEIAQKYGDNTVYLFFMNGSYYAHALGTFTKALDEPYEICFLPYHMYRRDMSPTIIAHEMIHLFGAPDLYTNDPEKMTNQATLKYKEYCDSNHNYDIMYVTGAPEKYELSPDTVTGGITDITAYYIGWLNSTPFEIDWFRLVRSQHETA